MTHEEYREAILDVAYLAACAVNRQTPDADRVSQMDLNLLYQAADRHLLTGITAFALESAGIKEKAFVQAKGKAIRKVVLMEAEKTALFARLEEEKIWYMPLKGALLKDLYPELGMRQMSDYDILFDASRADDVTGIMESLGFTVDRIGHGHHDAYEKEPVCRFEMHRKLFALRHGDLLNCYYRNVKDRLIRDDGNQYGYHFTPEDFYIYMIAHEYKHYSRGGTGLRSLLDIYVYLKRQELDWGYVEAEMEKLGIGEFEQLNRTLALHLFDGHVLNRAEQDMLEYVGSSGSYGTVAHKIEKAIQTNGGGVAGKLRYAWRRFYGPISREDPLYEIYTDYYSQFYKHWYLRPLMPFYRIWRGRRRVLAEIKTLWRASV